MRKFVILLLLSIALPVLAQKNEIALTAGAYFPAGTSIDIVPAAVVQGSYARRLVGVPLASVYAELPVAKTFDIGLFSDTASFSALFIVPGVKLKLAPEFPVSPWFALGGGVAHFSANARIAGTSVGRSSNSGVVDFGGGLDLKVAPFLSLRGEARDYYSGGLASLIPIPLLPGKQHNVIASAGFVIRF